MGLKQIQKKMEEQKSGMRKQTAPAATLGTVQKHTPILLKSTTAVQEPPVQPAPPQIAAPVRNLPPRRAVPKITHGQAESLLKGGENVLSQPIPAGYSALGKHDVEKLMWLKAEIIKAQICGFDYETNGDPDDDTTDPQDHKLVGASFAYKIGMAVYLPIAHDAYAANWDVDWLVENFLKPVLEHPDVLVIAHNVKFEHQISLLHGIDMFPKTALRKVMDTMLMVKALALPEDTQRIGDSWEVIVGLKPATKAHLADRNGMVHNLIHIDDIRSFAETVGKVEWVEEIPTGEFYKSGKNKGLPKVKKINHKRSRTFNELPVDKKVIDYGASDADWALGLFQKLMPICIAEGVDEVLWELDVPFMMALGEYELAGWHINPERLKTMATIADIALNGTAKYTLEGVDWRTVIPASQISNIMKLIDTYNPPSEADKKFMEEHNAAPTWVGLESLLHDALVDITVNRGFATLDDKGQVIVPVGSYNMGKWRRETVMLEIKNAREFNWNSPQHAPWLFFHVLAIDTAGLERSKTTGIPSCGKDNMEKMIEEFSGDSVFMKIMKEKKSYDKMMSTYVNGLLPYCREDTNKIHTNLKLVSTWRLSSSKPNLQNIPRADNDPIGIRGVFEAPYYDPHADYSHLNPFTKPVHIITERKLSGHTFYIGSDYSQIELKVLAWYAMEMGMIDILANGGDLHSFVAKLVFNLMCEIEEVKDKFKPHRYRAKKVNFGIVYGMTEFGLSKDRKMGMTQQQAKQFINDYYARFPGILQYAQEQIAFARKHGYVETMFSHRRPVPDINHPNEWVRKSAENQAMNTPIQGSASDIIRKAMVEIRRRIPTEAPYMKGVMQIHDEIQAECPVEYAIEGSLFIKKVMEEHVDGFSDIMPIVAEPAVGVIWQHALDIKFDGDGAYVKAKSNKKEATDVTLDEIEYALPLYKLAGIDVRVA